MTMTISVTDASPDAPVMRRSVEEAEAGRGLLLVDALSSRWGYEVREQGTRSRKVVWAEVAH
ncbi:ATP-binding protein [Streptomyces sp. YIM S03343]